MPFLIDEIWDEMWSAYVHGEIRFSSFHPTWSGAFYINSDLSG